MSSKDIWVLIEQDGSLLRSTKEILSEGRRLADKNGGRLCAILPGHGVDNLVADIAGLGTDTIFLIDNPVLATYKTEAYISVFTGLIKRYMPRAVFFGATLLARDLAPRLAAIIGANLMTDCHLVAAGENDTLVLAKPAFNGQIWVTSGISPGKTVLVTLSPGIFEISAVKRDPEVIHIDDIAIPDPVLKHEGVLKADPASIDISEAPVIAAGGRGLGKEGFAQLQQIAGLIGATIGGTRVAVDNGWVEYERQIGQTGKTVNPRFFISLGASGAMHYTAGFQDAEFILAVDKNPRAAIFDVADMGAVADINELLPVLLDSLKQISMENKMGSGL